MKRYNRVGLMAVVALLAAVSLVVAGSRSVAWMGVYTQAVDDDLADAFALPVDYGAIINEVVDDSPAADAGLREDDIIVSFNGIRVRDDDDLTDLVTDADPGDVVVVTVLRGDTRKDIQVELGRRPRYTRRFSDFDWFDPPKAPRLPSLPRMPNLPGMPKLPGLPGVYSYSFDFLDDEYAYIGVTLLDISERSAANLGADGYGVLIDDVDEDSPAEKAGLQPGDLIVTVDGEEVYEASDVQEIIRSLDEGDIARIEVVRDRDRSAIEVEVEIHENGRRYGRPDILRLPDLPDIDLNIPRMRGLRYGHSLDLDQFDSEEFQDQMKNLEKEMKRLKRELSEIKKALQ